MSINSCNLISSSKFYNKASENEQKKDNKGSLATKTAAFALGAIAIIGSLFVAYKACEGLDRELKLYKSEFSLKGAYSFSCAETPISLFTNLVCKSDSLERGYVVDRSFISTDIRYYDSNNQIEAEGYSSVFDPTNRLYVNSQGKLIGAIRKPGLLTSDLSDLIFTSYEFLDANGTVFAKATERFGTFQIRSKNDHKLLATVEKSFFRNFYDITVFKPKEIDPLLLIFMNIKDLSDWREAKRRRSSSSHDDD